MSRVKEPRGNADEKGKPGGGQQNSLKHTTSRLVYKNTMGVPGGGRTLIVRITKGSYRRMAGVPKRKRIQNTRGPREAGPAV